MPRRSSLWLTLGRLAAHRPGIILAAGVLTFLSCFTIDLFRGRDPLPEIHDEQAYLLAADTFAHGRLTNAPHALARSLETFHVIQHPTYQAKYPPGQGLFMALGTVLGGRPIVGVWISASILVSTLFWMLVAWFPPRWALLGTVTAAATMVLGGVPLVGGTPGYWSQTYWGGAAAALGGALALGGARRIIASPRWTSSAAMAVGIVILMLTRPFEGALLSIPIAIALGWWLIFSSRATRSRKLLHVVAPSACVLAAGAAWLCFYNWRVTGDPLRMPYMVYREQYQVLPIFRWQAPRTLPAHLNTPMLQYAGLEQKAGEQLAQPGRRLIDYYRTLAFEAGPLLAPALLLLLPLTMRRRWIAFAAGSWAFIGVGMWLSTYYEVHYHAPAAPLTIILLTATAREITLLRRHRALRLVSLAIVVFTMFNAGRQWYAFSHHPRRLLQHWAESRQEINDELIRKGGKHVIFVRYGPRHTPHVELVFNRADIDASPIVWVRELDPEQNASVLDYFRGRAFWLLNIEDDMGYGNMSPFQASAPSP